MALQYFLIVAFFTGLAALLYVVIRKRKSPFIAIPSAIVFVGLSTLTLFTCHLLSKSDDEAKKKFLGDYRLYHLDGDTCFDCKVTLYKDNRYEIFVDNRLIGHGSWSMETAIDIPGPFLHLENGPTNVIWPEDRRIQYIDRR